jgi:hypothetical protein
LDFLCFEYYFDFDLDLDFVFVFVFDFDFRGGAALGWAETNDVNTGLAWALQGKESLAWLKCSLGIRQYRFRCHGGTEKAPPICKVPSQVGHCKD